MKITERVVMVALALVLIGGATWLYVAYKYERQSLKDAVAEGEFELPLKSNQTESDDWRTYYPPSVSSGLDS
jgi:hypothetical protein